MMHGPQAVSTGLEPFPPKRQQYSQLVVFTDPPASGPFLPILCCSSGAPNPDSKLLALTKEIIAKVSQRHRGSRTIAVHFQRASLALSACGLCPVWAQVCALARICTDMHRWRVMNFLFTSSTHARSLPISPLPV